MSSTETHFGKLKKVETNLTIEDWCKEYCNNNGIDEIPSYYESWKETFLDKFNNKYFIVNNSIWQVIEHIESDDGSDIDVMIPNEDGTITFVQQFYNGGTCFEEVIEEGLKKLKV